MGQRGRTWLMIGILCGMLALTPILVGAQDDDAEATPEATAASVVTDEETTDLEATVEETTAEETIDEETTATEAETSSVVADSDAPRTLFDAYAVEDAPEEEAEEPAGIGLLFFLAGIGAVAAVGVAMVSRDSVNAS
ncbi:MAG: hypothetical protein RLP44_07835 [Aggregatilineales bacterium]